MSEGSGNGKNNGIAEIGGAALRLGVGLLSTKVKLIVFAVIAGVLVIALILGIAMIAAISSTDGGEDDPVAMANGMCTPAQPGAAAAATVSISGESVKSPVDKYPDSAMPVAAGIVAAARKEGWNDQAAVLAITAAMGESGLGTNPDAMDGPNADGDMGYYQQRVIEGDGAWYGEPDQVTDIEWATTTFLNGVDNKVGHMIGLKDIKGWEGMAPADAIHSVQKNAASTNYVYSDSYDDAKAVFGAVSGVDPETIENVGGVSGTASVNCAAGNGGEIAATGDAKGVVEAAKSQIGNPYVFGGGNGDGPTASSLRSEDAGETGYDCSGLTSYALKQGAGVELSRMASEQWADLRSKEVSSDDLQPGDLIFYSYGRKGGTVYHTAVYIGGDRMIEASHSSNEVVETKARVQGNDLGFVGAVRPLSSDAPQTGGDTK